MRSLVRWASVALIPFIASCQPQAGTETPAVPGASTPASAALKAATDCTFIDQAGAKRKLSEFKGTFIVLTEWAEWCPHCQAQVPKIQNELFKSYADKGIAFVNVEASRATASDVAAFASKLNVTMPLFYDDNKSTQTAYPIKGYPTTTFISPAFQVLETKSGEMPIPDYVTIFTPYLKR
jgi:peroxiredoxin